MYDDYHKYTYEGPVVVFGTCVASNWKGETMDPSEKKAKSNLAYQAKKQMNVIAGSKVTLPGKVKMVY